MALGSLYRPLLEVAKEQGVAIEPLLRELGLSEADVVRRGTRLSRTQGRAVAKALSRALGHGEVGLLAAERFVLADADLLGYLVRSAPNAQEALELLARYARLWGDNAACTIVNQRELTEVRLGLLGGYTLLDEAVDYAVGMLCRMLREGTGGAVVPVEVRLPRARPARPALYRQFFRTRVRFGSDAGVLVYPAAALRTPIASADPTLFALLEERARDMQAQLLPPVGLKEQVRAAIAEELAGGRFALPSVAERLGASERTLRRRLRAAGLSYRELLSDVRRERSIELIAAGNTRVIELAALLGFDDASAFARAFVRWTGTTPLAYIRQNAGAGRNSRAR